MCGRYASVSGRPELLETFAATDPTEGPDRTVEPLEPDYNVAPTKPVPAVLTRARREPDDGAGASERQLRLLRWGLVPSWAKDMSIGSRLINARAETLADKPAFRAALGRRRCLLPAKGWYEWYGERPRRQPYFITPSAGGLLAMAGLYELWRDRAAGPDAPWLWTATIVTGQAVDELGHLHDRAPRLVAPEDWATWLDPQVRDSDVVLPLLRTASPGELHAYPVSPAVGNVAAAGPALIEPLGRAPVAEVSGGDRPA